MVITLTIEDCAFLSIYLIYMVMLAKIKHVSTGVYNICRYTIV
jgi:hypothetical protein